MACFVCTKEERLCFLEAIKEKNITVHNNHSGQQTNTKANFSLVKRFMRITAYVLHAIELKHLQNRNFTWWKFFETLLLACGENCTGNCATLSDVCGHQMAVKWISAFYFKHFPL